MALNSLFQKLMIFPSSFVSCVASSPFPQRKGTAAAFVLVARMKGKYTGGDFVRLSAPLARPEQFPVALLYRAGFARRDPPAQTSVSLGHTGFPVKPRGNEREPLAAAASLGRLRPNTGPEPNRLKRRNSYT